MRSAELKIKAYAKLNLGLKILGKRPDGYHEIRTLLQSIDLADTLIIKGQREGGIRVEVEPTLSIPLPENLVYRAAKLLLRDGQAGVHIRVVKRIPLEAGLGGGSSDSAATLVGLNAHFRLDLSDARLHELAGELGSDVPFFLAGGLCEAHDRGQLIKKLPPLLWDRYFVLLVSPFRLPTASVYGEWDRLNKADKPQSEEVLSFVVSNEPTFIHLANDLEGAAISLNPELLEYRKYLEKAGAEFFGMSGSGPTYYAAFKHKDQAEDFAQKTKKMLSCEVFLAKPTNSGYEIIEED